MDNKPRTTIQGEGGSSNFGKTISAQPPPSNDETSPADEQQLLPPLPYSFTPPRRRRAIAIFFTLAIVETCFLPLVLYYSFRLGAHLSMRTNLAIVTSLVGTFSGFKLAVRAWVLWYREGGGSRRPIGGGKWGLDTFHVWVSAALTAFFVPLAIGSSLTPARPEAVAIALPCFMLVFCLPLAITGLFPRHIRVPFRISSMPAGQLIPPLTYTITEDVVGVDGGGKLAFRYALCRRYKVSQVMRRIMRITAIVWGLSGCIAAIGLIVAAWTAPTDVAFALGYGVPWVWAMFLALWTLFYVRRQLAFERDEWDRGVRHEIPLPVCASSGDGGVDPTHTGSANSQTASEKTLEKEVDHRAENLIEQSGPVYSNHTV